MDELDKINSTWVNHTNYATLKTTIKQWFSFYSTMYMAHNNRIMDISHAVC